jgi:catechol 2,3-dioxygenase-like lactoylglutathione lyase family enzyme
MKLERLIPILNVSNIQESFAWFEKLGWRKGWDRGDPPTFGGVCSGDAEIFLCQDGQGSRGGPMPRHVGDDDTGGVWMSWFLSSPAEVDATYQLALEQHLIVTWPPTDEPWGVRECHIRHPDGHTFRVGAGLLEE